MIRKIVSMEDAMDFATKSSTYAKVLAHRKICPKWRKDFCLECFGGGLTQFTSDLGYERIKN